LKSFVEWRILPQLAKRTDAEPQSTPVLLADAQSVIAREYGFDSWRHLKHHIETPDELKALALAVDAIDAGRVRELLQRSPEWVHARLYSPDSEDGGTVLGGAVMTRRKEESYIENMVGFALFSFCPLLIHRLVHFGPFSSPFVHSAK
jgi:hypothetical protein